MINEVDAIVVGSGPGGAITAKYLAEAGLSTLILEQGINLPHKMDEEYTSCEMVKKYKYGGLTTTTGSANINYVEGCCVGGGSEINSGLYHRTPDYVLERWRQTCHFSGNSKEMDKIFSQIEHYLSISRMPPHLIPEASKNLEKGATQLGVKCFEIPRWYKTINGEIEKTTVSKSYIKDALSFGAILKSEIKVLRILKDKSMWCVKAHANRGGPLSFRAKFLFICCGVMSSCALLRSSGINKKSGSFVRMHPTAKIVAQFENDLSHSKVSVPVHQVKEWAPKITLGCSVSKKSHLGLALLSNPQAFNRLDDTHTKMAIYYASISGGIGKIKKYPFNQYILDYKLSKTDFQNIRFGLLRLSEILFKAGAKHNFLVAQETLKYENYGEVEAYLTPQKLKKLDLMTIHLMGGNAFSKDGQGVCDEFGRVIGYENLFVQDASLIPTSLGVNPQGTIMALVTRNMEKFVNEAI